MSEACEHNKDLMNCLDCWDRCPNPRCREMVFAGQMKEHTCGIPAAADRVAALPPVSDYARREGITFPSVRVRIPRPA